MQCIQNTFRNVENVPGIKPSMVINKDICASKLINQVPESYWRQELGEGGSDSESNGLKWSFASRTLVGLVPCLINTNFVLETT